METLCKCGCGNPTKPAPYNSKRYGWVKGRPVSYLQGHWSRTEEAKKLRRIEGRAGTDHFRWKGGRVRFNKGYIGVYMPNHPRARKQGGRRTYVSEHILVAEQKYGRPIERGEIVHHLNGVKDDNRPENLVVVSRAGHGTHTVRQLMQERIRELEGGTR